jgi:hypothetical protein
MKSKEGSLSVVPASRRSGLLAQQRAKWLRARIWENLCQWPILPAAKLFYPLSIAIAPHPARNYRDRYDFITHECLFRINTEFRK